MEATRKLSRFYDDRARWSEVGPYRQCPLELADERNKSSQGEPYRRRRERSGGDFSPALTEGGAVPPAFTHPV
ncbi:hypothetical protein GCM10027032_14080 [Simplicispira piscis]